jgi:aryl-alcohol dehydrogenase-like predicted oxidoreductase
VTPLGHVAVGTWSGGRFMHFGEPLDDERFLALIRPGDDVPTVVTADTYGAGEADVLLGRSLAGLDRSSYTVVGAVGHDFYEGEREGAKGFPRFTDPRLRGPDEYASYLRMAAERSLERLGLDAFDVLLLHNPDRTGYTSEVVWDGMAGLREDGLTAAIGVAPGPANGFTLDLLDCFGRFGDRIDWAMVILSPMEPWPGELVLDAAAQHDVAVITRVADYGGLFWDDVLPGHAFAPRDHRMFRPKGWVERGREKLDRMRPIATNHGLTPMQLSAAYNLAQPAVKCVVPTLIQEPGGRPVESKRAELAATPPASPLSDAEVRQLRDIGDNTGSMLLKGGTPDHEGDPQTDRWAVDEPLEAIASRWGIDPRRDLAQTV